MNKLKHHESPSIVCSFNRSIDIANRFSYVYGEAEALMTQVLKIHDDRGVWKKNIGSLRV